MRTALLPRNVEAEARPPRDLDMTGIPLNTKPSCCSEMPTGLSHARSGPTTRFGCSISITGLRPWHLPTALHHPAREQKIIQNRVQKQSGNLYDQQQSLETTLPVDHYS